MSSSPVRILFTGYAPVHFLCFQPIYEQIKDYPGIEVKLSGGLRTKTPVGVRYNEFGLYGPFGVDRGRILTVEEIQQMDFDLLFVANTKPIEPRSVKERIQLFHGISFRNKAVRKAATPPDHFFMVGPYMLRAFRFRKLVQSGDSRVAKIGFPKTDPLVDGSLDRNEVLNRFGFSGYRPVVTYAPTGADHNSMATMGEELIQRLRESGKYDLIIKPHDHSHDGVDWPSRLARYEDEHTRLARADADVIPSLFVADLLITDASSVSNEFSLLDRPMVFLDTPELLLNEVENPKGLLDLGTWGRKGGLVARDPNEALDAVSESLAEPSRKASVRKKMARDLFYNPGQATQAAVNWLTEHIGLDREGVELATVAQR
ncbi:MAG: CDP-glycerol glycerophosphotransferase family protein [Acidimicrobiia bacterium]